MNLHLDNLKIHNKKEDKELIVPIKDIHSLIIDNDKSVLTVHLMNALSKYNVNVVLCGVDHLPKTLIIPQTGNEQAPLMLKRQIDWSEEIKGYVQKQIVMAKIKNQMKLLRYHGKDRDVIKKMEQFYSEVKFADRTNREGLAAKMYFRALFGSDFKRFDEDVVNFALNYGYAIMRSQVSKTIIAKGLTPCLGFFHKGPTNHFNLSDDFLEVFRPIVDHYVYEHLRGEERFKASHKIDLIAQTTKKIYFKNVKQTIFNTINQYVDTVIAFTETGDLNKVVHPTIKYDEL